MLSVCHRYAHRGDPRSHLQISLLSSSLVLCPPANKKKCPGQQARAISGAGVGAWQIVADLLERLSVSLSREAVSQKRAPQQHSPGVGGELHRKHTATQKHNNDTCDNSLGIDLERYEKKTQRTLSQRLLTDMGGGGGGAGPLSVSKSRS